MSTQALWVPKRGRDRDMRPFMEIVEESRRGRTEDECHPWAGTITEKGYASGNAHRRLWIESGMPDPGENHLDHHCHTLDPDCPGGRMCLHRRCINLRHLVIVAPAQNQHLRRERNAASRSAHSAS